MEKREKFIKASTELIRQISKEFYVSTVTVHHALNYDSNRGNSALARTLRRIALERGAKLFIEEPT